jgi:hypothetical protein
VAAPTQLNLLIQRVFGVFNAQSGALLGVTTSGEQPYQSIMGSAQIVNSLQSVRQIASTSNVAVFALGQNNPGDGGGGLFSFVSTDTTTGCYFTGTLTVGGALSVSHVNSGALAIGQSVSRGDTGAVVGTITSGSGSSWTLSAGAAISSVITFSADNNTNILVGFDGGRWYLNAPPVRGNLQSYGADPSGVIDSTTAITNAQAANQNVYVPPGLYITTNAANTLTSNFYGQGQIQTAGNKRGKIFSAISAAPSSLGNYSSVDTAFNGDWSHAQDSTEYRITGTATLSQPTSGYVYTPEATPHYTYLYNASGWNNSTSGNTGRTAAVAYRTQVFQNGQGDAVAYNGSVFVTGAKPGATNFLANPAGVLFNGDMTGGQNGVYLNPFEILLNDGGFDTAAIGVVYNLNRTVSTGALSVVWIGERFQNIGTQPVNSLISATGSYNNGIDFSMSALSFGANQAAISLKNGQRIYFNNNALASGNTAADWTTTGYNGDYISYTTGVGTILVNGGTTTLVSSATQLTAVLPLQINGGLEIAIATGTAGAGHLNIGTTTSGTATAGAATLPANPLGFLVMSLSGSNIKLPYYSP